MIPTTSEDQKTQLHGVRTFLFAYVAYYQSLIHYFDKSYFVGHLYACALYVRCMEIGLAILGVFKLTKKS